MLSPRRPLLSLAAATLFSGLVAIFTGSCGSPPPASTPPSAPPPPVTTTYRVNGSAKTCSCYLKGVVCITEVDDIPSKYFNTKCEDVTDVTANGWSMEFIPDPTCLNTFTFIQTISTNGTPQHVDATCEDKNKNLSTPGGIEIPSAPALDGPYALEGNVDVDSEIEIGVVMHSTDPKCDNTVIGTVRFSWHRPSHNGGDALKPGHATAISATIAPSTSPTTKPGDKFCMKLDGDSKGFRNAVSAWKAVGGTVP